MKRLFVALLVVLLPMAATAQMISSSSLTITKPKLPPVKSGFQSSVEAGYGGGVESCPSTLFVSYIGGYRFGNALFVGAGTGIDFNTDHVGKNDIASELSGLLESGHEVSVEDFVNSSLNVTMVDVPLFAHVKVYFLKERVSPYLSLSVGGVFSSKQTAVLPLGEVKYSTVGALIMPSLGVNVRMNEKHSVYLGATLRMRTYPGTETISAQSLTTRTRCGFSCGANVGFTF